LMPSKRAATQALYGTQMLPPGPESPQVIIIQRPTIAFVENHVASDGR
jgi:hypothetical protein